MIHSANALAARHSVIPFCTLCNVNRSAVFCKNDDAFLCASCDQEAHVGPLASRHERVPAANAPAPSSEKSPAEEVFGESSFGAHSEVMGDGLLKGAPEQPETSLGDFGVVPELSTPADAPETKTQVPVEDNLKAWGKDELDNLGAAWFDRLDMGYDFSDILDNSEPLFLQDAQVPSSSNGMVPNMAPSSVKEETMWADDGAVPDVSSFPEDPSAAWAKLPCYPADSDSMMKEDVEEKKGDITLIAVSAAQAAINRAQRLAKCREKKKNRTYEKTIRYATRKAYAEIRPRIKGRFVKKEELDAYRAMIAGESMLADDDCVVPTSVC